MLHVRQVLRWKSPLGPAACPYDTPLALARWFFYFRFEKAIELSEIRPGATALEIGCWEGHFLPSLADRCSRVVALDDDSASLIDRLAGNCFTTLQSARSLCLAEGVALDHVALTRARSEELPCRSGAFDAVFCLDTLPFVRAESIEAVLREIVRVLKPRGRVVFSLPVEIGPAVAVRETLRWLTGRWRDGYRLAEFARAIFQIPKSRAVNSEPRNLAGYDYRRDRRAIDAQFKICRTRFLPSNLLSFVAPTVLFLCRPR